MSTSSPGPREALAHRVRELMSSRDNVREVRMFGGQSFMVEGHLAVAVRSSGDLLVHIDPAAHDELVERGGEPASMANGRQMGTGWLSVPLPRLQDEAELAYWISVGIGTVAK